MAQQCRFTDDAQWIQGAPQPVNDVVLDQRLQTAFADPLTWDAKENSRNALHALSQHGLVVQVLGPSNSSLPHYIANTLLNFGVINNAPCQHGFQLRVPNNNTPITIPARSHLLLYRLSALLNTNVYVFSSRAKPRRFVSPNATSSIGFYHRIDSYHQTSEYLVLAPSSHVQPVLTTVASSAAPSQPGTHASPPATFRTTRRVRKWLVTKLPPISQKEKQQALENAW